MMKKQKQALAAASCVLTCAMLVSACGKSTAPVPSGSTAAPTEAASPEEAAAPEEASVASEPADIRVFKVGLNNPESHPLCQGIVRFGELLKEKSGGRFELEIFPGGQLGKPAVHMQSLQTGVLDISMSMPGMIADYGAEDLKVFTLPYLFRDIDHARAFQASDAGKALLDSVATSGTKMAAIGTYQESARHYFFKDKKVMHPSDLKGMKIRGQESSIALETMAAFGASPVSIAFSELYSALQTGIVDGAEQPLSGFYTNQFQEVSKYLILDAHELSPNIILFSEITWNSLSEEDQALIRECFDESAKYFAALSTETDIQLMEDIKASGVEVYEPENQEEWREAVQSVYDKYGVTYADIIKQIEATSN